MGTFAPEVNEFGETRGIRLRSMREMEGFSQRWMAKRIGIPRNKLEMLEKDEIPFEPLIIARINQLFNTNKWM